MRSVKTLGQVMLLAAGCLVALASSWEDWEERFWDETWMVSNVFDGQTAVPEDIVIELAVGYRDYSDNPDVGTPDGGEEPSAGKQTRRLAEAGMAEVELFAVDSPSEKVELSFDISWESTRIHHRGLDPDTDYVLDVSGIDDGMVVSRTPPSPVRFSTRQGPQVTGLWRNEDTLFITFSEPMDPETLGIAHDEVDVLWEEDGELHSLAGDANLAGFVWETDGFVFRVAPVDWTGSAWIKVSADARGQSGAYLDGNGNGVPGEPADDYLEDWALELLPQCFARPDVPQPCFAEGDPDGDGFADADW